MKRLLSSYLTTSNTRKLFIIWTFFVSVPMFSATFTTTNNGGNVSSGLSFVGGRAPNCASGTDTVVVVPRATLTFDINCQLGSTSAVGLGLRVEGALGTPGLVIVNTNTILTLYGADKTSNAALQVDQYGTFYPQPGATIQMGMASDNATAFIINGIIEDDVYGTSSKVNWTVPSPQINWNNSQSSFTPQVSTQFDPYLYPSLYITRMKQQWISNSSGTGLGGVGNSSITGFTITSNCTGCFTHEVGDWTSIAATGDYYVDYDKGLLYFYNTGRGIPNFSVNGNKYLTFVSGPILITANTTYNEGVFNNSSFSYMGSAINNGAALVFGNKQSDTISGQTHRKMRVTNSVFQFTKGPILVTFYSQGSSSDPLLIDSNIFYQNIQSYNQCCGFVTLYNAGADYLTVSNNDVRATQWPGTAAQGLLNCYGTTTYKSSTGDQLVSNIVQGGYSLATAYTVGTCGFPGLLVDGNLVNGAAYVSSDMVVSTLEGTAVKPITVSNNYLGHPYRPFTYNKFTNFTQNFITGSNHHGFIPTEFADYLSEGISITNNIFVDGPSVSCMQTGYAARVLVDNLVFANNTCILTQTGSFISGAFDFTDSRDAGSQNGPVALVTNLIAYNNLNVTERVVWGRYADDRYGMSRVQLAVADWNDDYTPTVGDYCTGYTDGNGANPHSCTLNRLATFTINGVEYDTDAGRNVTGVTLANPSYSMPQSGRTLAWAYTGPSNVTLSWGGGTPVPVAHYSNIGTVSGGHQTYHVGNRSGYIIDTGQSFDTQHNSGGACEGGTCTPDPTGEWIILTGGTGAGQIRRVINDCDTLNQNTDIVCTGSTSRTMEVVPDWTTVPDSTTSYVTWYSELKLFDSGGVNWISAEISPWSSSTQDGMSGTPNYQTPTFSNNDVGIGIAFNMSNLQPNIQNYHNVATTPANCSLATWNADVQAGASNETAALTSIRANHTLIESSLLPYLRSCYTPVLTTLQGNCSFATAAYGGTYFGAVAPNLAGCGH
jgi:hypothetical protein